MEELDLNNILSPEEMDNLFDEEGSETQETPPESTEEKEQNKETTEVQVDAEDLFE